LEGIAYKLMEKGFKASRALKLTYSLIAFLTVSAIVLPWLFLALYIPFNELVEHIDHSTRYFTLLVGIFNISLLLDIIIFDGLLRTKKPKVEEEWLYDVLEDVKRSINYEGKVKLEVADSEILTACSMPGEIVVTRGLINVLDRECVKAILAHELGHWKRGLNILAIQVLIMFTFFNAAILIEAVATPWKMNLTPTVLFAITLPISIIGAFSLRRLEEHFADEFSVKAMRSTTLIKALGELENATSKTKTMKISKPLIPLAPLLLLGAILMLLYQPSSEARKYVIEQCRKELERGS
jgi:Zn-dependent protease with chaperone function